MVQVSKALILVAVFHLNYSNGLRILTPKYKKDVKSLNDLGLDPQKTSFITFQVAACSDVYVVLFDNIYGPYNPRYELVIGGWNNTKSQLRRGDAEIRTIVHAPLDCCRFVAFWVSWDNGNIRAGHGFNVGDRAFFEVLNTGMNNVNKVGVFTNWGFRGVWALSLDDSPLMPSDYDVDGYLQCNKETVAYYIPLHPTTSENVYLTSSETEYPTSSETGYLQLTSSEITYSSSSDTECVDLKTCSTGHFTPSLSLVGPLMTKEPRPSSSELTTLMPNLMTPMSSLPTQEAIQVTPDFILTTSSSISMMTMLSLLKTTNSSDHSDQEQKTFSPTSASIREMTSSPEMMSTASSPFTLATTTPDTTCVYCPCVWPLYGMSNLSLSQKIERIRETLTLVKYNLSAVRRRLTSAYDVRPSSRYVGASGATILALVIGLIIMADIQRVVEFLLDRKKSVREIILIKSPSDTSAC